MSENFPGMAFVRICFRKMTGRGNYHILLRNLFALQGCHSHSFDRKGMETDSTEKL
jgi:hypothetical protein